jgi:hypothetical protein
LRIEDCELIDERGLLSADTSREIEEMQIERWRAMTPVEKLQLVSGFCRMVDVIAIAGIRMRYPAASDRECFLRLAAIKLGRDLASSVYPDLHALSD